MKVLFDWKVKFICDGITYMPGREYVITKKMAERYSAMFKVIGDDHDAESCKDMKCEHKDCAHKHEKKVEILDKLVDAKKDEDKK